MRIWSDNDELEGADLLAQVLRCVQSSHLKKCDITLSIFGQYGFTRQYGCTRNDMLNIISGEAVQQCSEKWLSIPEFIISLIDNDAAFGEDWWTTEITKNLPNLKDMLTVKVDIDGMSIAYFIEGQCAEHICNGMKCRKSIYGTPTQTELRLVVEAAASM